jgi:hypothetical protein
MLFQNFAEDCKSEIENGEALNEVNPNSKIKLFRQQIIG